MPLKISMPNMYFFDNRVINPDNNETDYSLDNTKWTDNLFPYQRLRFVIRKLLTCNVPEVRYILDRHKVILVTQTPT